MANIYDYLNWRGDISFVESEFNQIDALILARLSYFPFERIWDIDHSLTIKEAYEKAVLLKVPVKAYIQKEDITLFKMLSENARFKDLKLKNFESILDLEKEKQFAAITIVLPNNFIYISYRGTDSTFVGWKEDFNMTFNKNVPAQIEALDYLNSLKIKMFSKVILGGHSKGGNLAVYASINCKESIKKKIVSIFNIDGPGFLEDTINSIEYQNIQERVHTLVPETAIVGKLLNHDDGYKTIKSTQKLIMQHDIYSWQLMKTEFIYADDIDKDSALINSILTKWLAQLSFEDREQMINIIYQLITATDALKFQELTLNKFDKIKKVYKSYKNISKEDKKMLDKMFDLLFVSIKDSIFKKEKQLTN